MMLRVGLLLLLSAALLAGCAGPLTTARNGVRGCSVFLQRADGGSIPQVTRAIEGTAARAAGGAARDLNLLVLSGGGKYGAYGAGVLSGWSEAEAAGDIGAGGMHRADIDIVTGISTGALLTTFAVVGNAAATPEERAAIDADMREAYRVDQGDLLIERGLLRSISSNGIADIRGRLDTRLQATIDRYWDRLRSLPPSREALVGVVNLTNGAFYVADLLEIARSGQSNAKSCYREIVLASAAVPVQFPPRFIDGDAYVDGGVRFGLFLGQQFGAAARARAAARAPVTRVNFRAIVNGNLSPNAPDDDPAAAAACDAAPLAEAARVCPPVGNTILAIAQRSAGAILVDQGYRDSAWRLYAALKLGDALGRKHGYVYVPNSRIAEEASVRPCTRATRAGFDRRFMDCLSAIGRADGRQQNWRSVEDLPRAALAPS